MSRRWRVVLAVVGLLLVCLSAAALVYALTPVDRTREQFRPEPTLFSPPQSYLWDAPGLADLSGARPTCLTMLAPHSAHLTGLAKDSFAIGQPMPGRERLGRQFNCRPNGRLAAGCQEWCG